MSAVDAGHVQAAAVLELHGMGDPRQERRTGEVGTAQVGAEDVTAKPTLRKLLVTGQARTQSGT